MEGEARQGHVCEQLTCFITRLFLIAPSGTEPGPTRAKVTKIHLDTLPLWTTWNWNVSGMAEVFTGTSWETAYSRLSTTLEIRKPRPSGQRRFTH